MSANPTTTDDVLASRTRTPKGRQTLQAILDATFDLVGTGGLAAASQEAVATRANVSQSALRYYFPTKNDLLYAFFLASIERLEKQFKEELATTDKDPRSQLITIASLHYDRMLEVEDVFFFDTASFWSLNPGYRKIRNSWWRRMSGYYADLIQAMHPEWDSERCTASAFQVSTLVLGGWTTLGSSRPFHQRRDRKELKAMLIDGIERLLA